MERDAWTIALGLAIYGSPSFAFPQPIGDLISEWILGLQYLDMALA